MASAFGLEKEVPGSVGDNQSEPQAASGDVLSSGFAHNSCRDSWVKEHNTRQKTSHRGAAAMAWERERSGGRLPSQWATP